MANTRLNDKQKKHSAYLIHLIKSVLHNEVPDEPQGDIDFKYLFDMAKSHSVTAMAFSAVEKLKNKPDDELFKNWRNKRGMMYHKSMIQTEEYKAIKEAFRNNNIDFMPMKGFEISKLYPKIEMREMSDCDFLLKDYDLKEAGQILSEKGYSKQQVGTGHHDTYIKKPFMFIELHRDLVGISCDYYDYFKDIFARSERVEKNEYQMTNEDFYIFVLVHFNRHFNDAGCGIRNIIDMYVLNRNFLPKINKEFVIKELKKMGLYDFFRCVSNIAEKWFDGDLVKSFGKEEEYMILSGSYGNKQNKLENNHKGRSSKKYVFVRLFPKPDRMCYIYPVLRKYIWLIPFFYVGRLVKAPFTKGKKIKAEIEYFKNKH